MKNYNLFQFICITACAFFIFSCDDNHDDHNHQNSNPEIHIHAPLSTDMPAQNSLVNIDIHVTDDEELHDVWINITADNNPNNILNISYSHIHNTDFMIDTSFITNLHIGDMANYTIEVIAEDFDGKTSSSLVTFHVMDSQNGNPEINIIAPVSEIDGIEMVYPPNSLIDIDINVTDNQELENVFMNIVADNNTSNILNFSYNHIHNTDFMIDESFMANLHIGDMANYTIEVIAEYFQGNTSSSSVTFLVKNP